MWNNNENHGGGPPPSFPSFPSGDSAFPQPSGGGGYHPGYAPSYGSPPGQSSPYPPPSGYGFPPASPMPNSSSPYGAPPGPPLPHASSPYGAPPGPPPSGYGAPPGPPPSGYGSPQGTSGGYAPPSGPPPSGFGAPSGTPSSGYHPPSGPPPVNKGFPGAQYHQQHSNSGYPGAQQHFNAPGANTFHPNGPPPRPPNQAQHYGPHFQGANHQDAQPFFQYSQCNGKKKGLFIGINYFGQNGELRGCINDVQNIQSFLIQRFGYKKEDMVTLTDDQKDARGRPTRDNIIQAMQWLVRGAQPNDALFFHYSGHGGQVKDTDGDEGDGYDEVIYPVDFEAKGEIVDDLMHNIMVKPLPPGCRLTAIFDSCHSGSALDLPYIYSTEGKVKEPNLAAEAGQGLLSAVTSYAKGDMGGVFKSAMGIVKTATGKNQKADKIAKATRTSPADVISFSGCKDTQTSADTSEAGKATGAMSFAFIQALGLNTQQSYQELLVGIRTILKSKYSQKPQLSSSHPMDTNIMFLC
ncbi:caspase domain-containing protein [Crepidotus variabilis]|uniref:Caspase domain-containing protein n=1 Tax=Crepidotus variabilis TaxID=179855 RepID=A0A9P6ESM3_9AGAR|nr:caspase domain-containing protein [Crepidotus variabilis]